MHRRLPPFSAYQIQRPTVLRLNQTLTDLLPHIKIVAWREVMTGENSDYDIAFCEGSINSKSDLERIRQIRKQTDIVAALGTCASIGCHNALEDLDETVQMFKIFRLPDLECETEYVSLKHPDHYAFYDGDLYSSEGKTVKVQASFNCD